MTPAERDLVMDRILTAWPRPKLADKAVLLWHEHLNPLDIVRALDATKALESSSRNRPAISDFHAAYGPTAPKTSTQAPDCGICDNGWVEVAPGIIPTVRRCPNGCMPMTADERQARDRVDRHQWARQATRRPAGGARDYSEPDREEVELDF